ncbi:uncharacterized protein LOC133191151 [Saccostrea echinata]|uniref:uncharacterized protein LOC133191151 n=1 Tax=Saccostrea echinata TaxID=191078 RepID=UPI002A83C170|nr:uncharacterized protein LOC133191151 [Saccostrea echinata]
MSTDNADNVSPGNDERERGDSSDNTSIVAMMKEMQKNIASLTSTVCELQQKRGKKRKAEDDKPGPSGLDLSDVSEDEDGGKDDLDELLEEVNKDVDSDCDDMLDGLVECFGGEDKCSEAINEKLAKGANDGLRSILDADKIKELSEKYNRPKNVPNIVTPKLNEEIRAQLSRKMRSQDIRLQRTQTLLGKAIVPVLQQINLLVKSKQKGEMPSRKELSNLAMDGLKLMAVAYCDLSNRRRELIIQPERNEEFRTLCSNEHPVTDKLFGDDLGKRVEDIVKANKVGAKISGHQKFDKRGYQNRKFQQGQRSSSSYNQHYRTQNFLGQRWGPHYRKKTTTTNKQKK